MISNKDLNNNKKPINEEECEGLELLTEGSNGPLLDGSRKLVASKKEEK